MNDNPTPEEGGGNDKVTLAVLSSQLENIQGTMKDVNEKLDSLPCNDRALELERVRGNFRALVIVLVATGVLGGGGIGLAKLLTGG